MAQENEYAPSDFYLIDTLNLNLISNEELHYIDSCLTIYHESTSDTTKILALFSIVDNIWNDNVWPLYNRYVMDRILNTVSYSASKEEKKFMQKSLGSALNNEGFFQRSQGNYPMAIQYYLESLKIFELIEDQQSLTFSYNNLGVLYQQQFDYDKALEYHNKSLEQSKTVGDSAMIAYSLNNIGVVWQLKDSLVFALNYFQAGLELYTKFNNVRGQANGHYNMGFVYLQLDSLAASEVHFEKSLDGFESIREEYGISLVCSGWGELDLKLGRIESAKIRGEYGLQLAKKLHDPDLMKRNANLLYEVAVKNGDWKHALEMRNLEVSMIDSIESMDNIRANAKAEAGYAFEKQQAIRDTEHRKEMEKQQSLSLAEKKRQNVIITAVSVGLLIVVIFTYFLVKRFRITQRQKQIIEEQKFVVEEKNKEILDSIHYARRIQNAILPSMNAMQLALRDGFVLYKPKDVVAGDFFWMEKSDTNVYFAAADCTGHGVPGAMVSVVCSHALSKALLEENAKTTGQLLDKTREIVIDRLAKSGDEMKDGMDISICAVDFSNLTMMWSGANNPLWIVRDKRLIEYKPDKQPIGLYSKKSSFQTHYIELFKGDKLYIMTDGFQDQFGGPSGKKFKSAQLKDCLLSLEAESMDQQKIVLNQTFENWKENSEQIDDVCLIGIRI